MSKTTDYSQFGEQAAILKSVRSDPGRFLDIGAWNPRTFSNTRALYERGWSGIMIEPSPGPMLNLLEAYGNDDSIVLIAAAVSVEPGLAHLHVTDDAVSTSVVAEYERWKDQTKFRGTVFVPTISVEEIATRFGGFDFVNIDAEGHSTDLLLQMLKAGIFPPVVCVEHEGRTTEIITRVSSIGYRVEMGNSTNMVLVAR